MPIKLIQINLNRSRLAQDIMTHNVSVLGADVVVISEPYRQLAAGSMTPRGMPRCG